MLWSNINFWRLTSLVFFITVLVLAYPHLGREPRFVLDSTNVEIVDAPEHGAKCSFTVRNEGGSDGDAYISCHLYLYERGGDTEEDYTVLGVNSGESKSGEIFIPLGPNQTIHDWQVLID
jgi:hypothetical protein